MRSILQKTLPGGQFANVTRNRSRHMASVKAQGNKTTERKLRAGLVAAGVAGWELSPQDVAGRPDFFFRSAGVAVFVDGCFWHGCARCGHVPGVHRRFWEAKLRSNRLRDRRVRLLLRRQGIGVIRIWEHELKLGTRLPISRIRRFLMQQPVSSLGA